MKSPIVLRTFVDFSATKRCPWRWTLQALCCRDVTVFWDPTQFDGAGAWRREVRKVRCVIREHAADRAYVPLPGQIIEYQQWENK